MTCAPPMPSSSRPRSSRPRTGRRRSNRHPRRAARTGCAPRGLSRAAGLTRLRPARARTRPPRRTRASHPRRGPLELGAGDRARCEANASRSTAPTPSRLGLRSSASTAPQSLPARTASPRPAASQRAMRGRARMRSGRRAATRARGPSRAGARHRRGRRSSSECRRASMLLAGLPPREADLPGQLDVLLDQLAAELRIAAQELDRARFPDASHSPTSCPAGGSRPGSPPATPVHDRSRRCRGTTCRARKSIVISPASSPAAR